MKRQAAKRLETVRAVQPEVSRQSNIAERGQALIELALALSLLCLLSIGIIEIGRAARMSMVITNAATAGAQFGSQSSTDAGNTLGIQNAALCDANGGYWGSCHSGILTASNITIHHACRCDDGTGLSCELPLPADGTCDTISCGTEPVVECVQVTTNATFAPLFSWPGLPSSYQSNGNSVMRVQQ